LEAELLANRPKDSKGRHGLADKREVEEIVPALLIEFPTPEKDQRLEPPEDLPSKGGQNFRQPPAQQPREATARESADLADCWSCPTHWAVRRFADAEFDALAQNIVEQLRGIDATGIYGDDYRHETLWDEYCHEIQEGSLGLSRAWDSTIAPFLIEALANIPQEVAVLMTIGAGFRLEEDDGEQAGDFVTNPDMIQRRLEQVLVEMAAARNMSQFDPGECDGPEEEDDPEEDPGEDR
jgi:hypothetical protein